MIQVSNEFKKAIKATERRIKGYVEVLYDVKEVESTNTAYFTSTYTDISQITDNKRVANDYGTLDYLPLDGSRLTVVDGINQSAGYISDDLFENIDNCSISLSFLETTLSGLTLYFKDNIPTSFRITFSDNTVQSISNDKEIVQVEFDSPKTMTGFSITFDEMEHNDRKIRIEEIDFGISTVYQGKELIEFTIDEEVNKLVEEVPINECNITIGNYDDKFNPINPQGITKYLNNSVLIIPYIGVLTENFGVEYVKMGEFFFDSYTNNSDKTTTLVGVNVLKQIEGETLKNDNETDLFTTILYQTDFEKFMSNYNYKLNKLDWTADLWTITLVDNSLINFLKDMAFMQWNIFYADRNNKLNMTQINTKIQDKITKSELINDVNFKYVDKINTIKFIVNSPGSSTAVDEEVIFKDSVILSKPSEIFLLKHNEACGLSSSISQTGGKSATIISEGFYMSFVKVVGEVGATVDLKISSKYSYSPCIIERILTKKKGGKETILEINNPMNYLLGYMKNSPILDITPSYEMNFEYNGDPSLEAGDYINVETPYGYRKLFIQKNHFKFDGGLSGNIEGVE